MKLSVRETLANRILHYKKPSDLYSFHLDRTSEGIYRLFYKHRPVLRLANNAAAVCMRNNPQRELNRVLEHLLQTFVAHGYLSPNNRFCVWQEPNGLQLKLKLNHWIPLKRTMELRELHPLGLSGSKECSGESLCLAEESMPSRERLKQKDINELTTNHARWIKDNQEIRVLYHNQFVGTLNENLIIPIPKNPSIDLKAFILALIKRFGRLVIARWKGDTIIIKKTNKTYGNKAKPITYKKGDTLMIPSKD